MSSVAASLQAREVVIISDEIKFKPGQEVGEII